MKIFIYAMREFDELDVAERVKQEYGIDFGWERRVSYDGECRSGTRV